MKRLKQLTHQENSDKNVISKKRTPKRFFNRFSGRLIAGLLSLTLAGGTAALSGCSTRTTKQTKRIELSPEKRQDLTISLFYHVKEDRNLLNVARLLELGADVNAEHHNGYTVLMAASIPDNNEAIVELLLGYGAKKLTPAQQQAVLNYKLLEGAAEADLEKVRRLLDEGADVNTKIGHVTPLMEAAYYGKEKEILPVVKLLLERGADVNFIETGYGDDTALKRAERCGFARVVKLLKKHGPKDLRGGQ